MTPAWLTVAFSRPFVMLANGQPLPSSMDIVGLQGSTASVNAHSILENSPRRVVRTRRESFPHASMRPNSP
ncbi:MAG: hypothetical protein IKN52_09100 [Victivallales bacterium]|nr:hypothetical protein [Victivallales bacterium]